MNWTTRLLASEQRHLVGSRDTDPSGTQYARQHAGRSESKSVENEHEASWVGIDQFLTIEIRVGRVVRVEVFPKARSPAYKLWIDFGDLGIRTSSAQLTKLYMPEELRGRQVMAVVNLPPRQVADFISEVLVLGVPTGEDGVVVLVGPDRDVPAGLRLL